MSNARTLMAAAAWLLAVMAAASSVHARSSPGGPVESQAPVRAPSEQHLDEESTLISDDIQRVVRQQANRPQELHLAASGETAVPVYASPYLRPERATAEQANLFDSSSESSQAPPNYAPKPSADQQQPTRDLKTAASYGHHHGGYEGSEDGHYDSSGWLDMGAWTGGKGSFGWYADYPVGGKQHHHGHGRK